MKMTHWHPLKINEKPWVIKFKSENKKITCLISDFKSVFSEEVNFEEVLNRAKVGNMR